MFKIRVWFQRQWKKKKKINQYRYIRVVPLYGLISLTTLWRPIELWKPEFSKINSHWKWYVSYSESSYWRYMLKKHISVLCVPYFMENSSSFVGKKEISVKYWGIQKMNRSLIGSFKITCDWQLCKLMESITRMFFDCFIKFFNRDHCLF